MKFSIYLNRHVFVMGSIRRDDTDMKNYIDFYYLIYQFYCNKTALITIELKQTNKRTEHDNVVKKHAIESDLLVENHKEDIVMQDLCSGSPDPEVLNCLFEDCPDDIRVVMSTQEFRSKLPRPHLSESIKYRSMTDTETHKRFMSLWAYKYPPASCGGMCFFFKLR